MKFPSYESYADINHPWFPKAPSHWHLSKLKYLFELIKEPAHEQDEIVTCFRDGEVTLRKNRREDGFTNALKEIGYQHVEINDLVIHAMDAFAGAIGVSDSPGKSSPVYSVCRPILGLSNSKYFAKLLRHMALSGFVESLAKGIRERSTDFRWADAGNIKLPVPPIAEQQKIAQFLDYETSKIDALIDEQKRLIELLKEKRQAVISHAVTKGLNPDAPMKDSNIEWLGQVPEHWTVAPLKWFSTIRGGIAMGKRYDSDEKLVECPYLRVANVQSGHFNFSEIKTVKVTYSEAIKYRLKFGEVLMNEGGDNDKLGRGAIWRDDIPNCLHQNHVFAINIEKGLLPEWLATFTESSSARAYFYLYSKQSTNLASISSSNVVSCLLPIPPKAEQKSILSKLAQEVDAIDNLNNESIKMMEMLKERRSALISAAVTGKIDVRDWQPPAGSDTVDSNASVQTERHYG